MSPDLPGTDDALVAGGRRRAGPAGPPAAPVRAHPARRHRVRRQSDEWEVQALLNPVYDVNRLGIFFTASPRHADVLLVTGVGAHGMAAPLRRTLDAMPRPVVVIAAGADAISGGLVAPTYAVAGGIGDMVPVDVWVAGSPASPFALLLALLLAMGRLPDTGTEGRRDERAVGGLTLVAPAGAVDPLAGGGRRGRGRCVSARAAAASCSPS